MSDAGLFEAADLRAELRRVGLRSDDIPTTDDTSNDADEVLELSKRLFTTKYMRVEDLPSDLLLDGGVVADESGGTDGGDDSDNEKSDTVPSSNSSSASSTPDAAAVGVAAKIGLGFLQNSQGGMSNPFAKKEPTGTSSSTAGSSSSNPFPTGKQSANAGSNNPFNKAPGSSGPGGKGNASSNPFASKPASGMSNASNPFAKKEGSSSNPFAGTNPFGGGENGGAPKSSFNPFASKPSLDSKADDIDTEEEAGDENVKDTKNSEASMGPGVGNEDGKDEEKNDDAEETAEDDRIVAELKATEEKARQVKLEAEKVKAKILASQSAEKTTAPPTNPFASSTPASNPFTKKKDDSPSNPFASKNIGAETSGASPMNPFASPLSGGNNPFAQKKEDTDNDSDGAKDDATDGRKLSPFGAAPSTTAVNPFATKKVNSPANPFAKKPSEAGDHSDDAKDDTGTAEMKKSASPFESAPPAGAIANPFATKKVDSPVNPFANQSSEADDDSDEAKDDTADVKKTASPFGAAPPTTANPFLAKKVDSPPANPFASKKDTNNESDDDTNDTSDEDSKDTAAGDEVTENKSASPIGLAAKAGAMANPFVKKADSTPANPFAAKKDSVDAGEENGEDDDTEEKKATVSPFGSVPSASAKANPFAKKVDSPPANPFATKPVDSSANEGGKDAEARKVVSPFGAGPSTDAAANPFAKAKQADSPPVNPFAATKSAGDDKSDETAETDKKSTLPFGAGPPASATASPFGNSADSPANPFAAAKPVDKTVGAAETEKTTASPIGAGISTGATANPFAKKTESPPANPFASASSIPTPADTKTDDASAPPKSSSQFGSPASNPFGVAPKASGGPGAESSSPFGSPPPTAASNPFGGPPKAPAAPSGDTAQSANPFGATPPSPGLGASASESQSTPASNTPLAAQDAKSEDPFAFFAAPPPTMEEVADFVDPFGKEEPPEAAPPAEDPTAAQISQKLAAERREAERLDAELAAAEEKDAQQATQRQQSATPTDQGMSISSDPDTSSGGANGEVYEEEEYEEEVVDIEITPDAIDQIRSWDPVSFSWRVGARHFMSNDDFRSLSSPVEMGYGHGFFLRLHLQGPRAGVELRIGDITADLVLRNMEIFLHCGDQYGQRIVAHAAALENGSCASEDDLNSFGCCPFVYENDDGIMMEVSRQMLYQQAKGGGLRIEGYFEVGAVSSYR